MLEQVGQGPDTGSSWESGHSRIVGDESVVSRVAVDWCLGSRGGWDLNQHSITSWARRLGSALPGGPSRTLVAWALTLADKICSLATVWVVSFGADMVGIC